jgi:lysophospholipase L1-like esterase
MHKPWRSLVFGILTFAAFAMVSLLMPESGFRVGNITMDFPSISSFFDDPPPKKNVAAVLQAFNDIDTSFALDETFREKKSPVKKERLPLITGLQYKSAAAMKNFYAALNGLKEDPASIRVMHYGDSQIEGDRITDFIRLKLQSQFGGTGPGLISLMPITNSVINRISNGPGWDRYNVFTAKDARVRHSNYGALASFSRYCGYRKINDTSAVFTTSLGIVTTENGGVSAMMYNKLKLFYGGSQTKTWCRFYDGPALISADSLQAGGMFRISEYNVTQGSNNHIFKFAGKDSPDFYAVSLEGDSGVLVDNIALRGSSGTFFHLINKEQLRQFYDYLNVKLIILQFGGNSMPSIEDTLMARNFADYLRFQISILKKVAPGASILFIGPSDMSIKSGTQYITYPMLEPMRDALRKMVLDNGCAFFDMYDCMGGRNSMPVWVEQKLAGADYTHFSPQGARKISTMLYAALIEDYNKFLKSKN